MVSQQLDWILGPVWSGVKPTSNNGNSACLGLSTRLGISSDLSGIFETDGLWISKPGSRFRLLELIARFYWCKSKYLSLPLWKVNHLALHSFPFAIFEFQNILPCLPFSSITFVNKRKRNVRFLSEFLFTPTVRINPSLSLLWFSFDCSLFLISKIYFGFSSLCFTLYFL